MNNPSHDLQPASNNDLSDAINTAHIFRGVGTEAIEVFLESSNVLSIPKGTVLISPLSDDKALYVVLSGTLAVRLEDRDDAPLTQLVRGQCAGEMSILENSAPSAYVSAASDCRLLVVEENTVWNLINTSHGVARNLLEVLSQRLRFDNEHIVDRSEIIEQYRRNATTDALTDLHNRYWMQVMFARKIKRAKTSGSAMCLAVLDLDRFKAFNDEHGHQLGDTLLQKVAGALRDLFRANDLIARFGGDEFAVLLPETTLETAKAVGERVRAGILKRVSDVAPVNQNVTISIGLTELYADDNLEALLKRADNALYRAKSLGRNRVSA